MAERQTCYYCKHWGELCGEEFPGGHYCEHPSVGESQANSAQVVNGDPYNEGRLATGSHFGCVNFEAK